MENSKQIKSSEDKYSLDMISKLPDPILHLILSRIPATEEVIRTSILSTRWRYLWTSLPSIDIDYTRRLNPYKGFEKDKFDKFMCHILENNPLDLNTFRLHCGNHYTMLPIRRWIKAATLRKLKSLDLKFWLRNEHESINVPDCGSLEVLKLTLFGCCLSLPNCNGFSVLRVLELNNVRLCNGDILTNFLQNCPLLEELRLKNLEVSRTLSFSNIEMFCLDEDFNPNIQICCPKLVFLELEGYIGCYKTSGLDSLKKAVIKPGESLSGSIGNTVYELFAGISLVESLSINLFMILECIHSAYFPNLKTLELTATIDDFPMDNLIHILKYYPHLEALHLIIKDVLSDRMRKSFQFAHEKLEEVETRGILTRHLKKVEFLEFNGEHASLYLARLLLLYGDVLEEMVFSWDDQDKYPRKSRETVKKMSKFHKASSSVKFVTLLKE